MAVNKVIYGSNTIIDITDTTATPSDVISGKYFYLANGQKAAGTASVTAYSDVVEILPNGAEHHIITGDINLAADTVTADTLLEGYTAHNANGTSITGTFSGESYLTASLIVTNNFQNNGFMLNVPLKWNSATKKLAPGAYDLPPAGMGSNVVTIPMTTGINLVYINSSSIEINFTNLSSGVTVLNNGEKIQINSSTSWYILQVRTSNASARSFTIEPKTT